MRIAFFVKDIDTEDGWLRTKAALYALRDLLIDRRSMVVNVTADAGILAAFEPKLADFVAGLPALDAPLQTWQAAGPLNEGLTFPAQVNYVAKGANLYALGYKHSGATSVAADSWTWRQASAGPRHEPWKVM